MEQKKPCVDFIYEGWNERSGMVPLVSKINDVCVNGKACIVYITDKIIAFECVRQLEEKHPSIAWALWADSQSKKTAERQLRKFNRKTADVLICTTTVWMTPLKVKIKRKANVLISFHTLMAEIEREQREEILDTEGDDRAIHIHLCPHWN